MSDCGCMLGTFDFGAIIGCVYHKIARSTLCSWQPLSSVGFITQLWWNSFGDRRFKDNMLDLHEAAFQGCLPDIDFALNKGEDPNSKDNAGSSAIHKAAANGHLTCLQRLMEKGGDVSQEDAAGCTVLHVAARNGHIETVKWLISNGCDVNTLSRKGNTARDLARANGQAEVSKYLKEYGREKFEWETMVN